MEQQLRLQDAAFNMDILATYQQEFSSKKNVETQLCLY
jgi:hypothetical protein